MTRVRSQKHTRIGQARDPGGKAGGDDRARWASARLVTRSDWTMRRSSPGCRGPNSPCGSHGG